MSGTHTPRDDNNAKAPSSDATAKPVAPAIPSESGVGEEDPGDFENASISAGDGERPAAPPAKPDRRR